MATRIPNATRSAAANAVVDLLDAGAAEGYIEIRSGSQPADPDDAASGSVLATIPLGDPAFGAAANGVATANSIDVVQGTGSGTAGWFRAYDSDANSVVDGSVTASGGGGDMTLNTTTISVGIDIAVTSWTVTMPAS